MHSLSSSSEFYYEFADDLEITHTDRGCKERSE